jgi:hypothetical protein
MFASGDGIVGKVLIRNLRAWISDSGRRCILFLIAMLGLKWVIH